MDHTSCQTNGFGQGPLGQCHGNVLAEVFGGSPAVTGIDVLQHGLGKGLDLCLGGGLAFGICLGGDSPHGYRSRHAVGNAHVFHDLLVCRQLHVH